MTTNQISSQSIDQTTTQPSTEILKCGLIMPIAPLLDYTAEHWIEVKGIISQAVNQIKDLKFKTDIVSNSDGEIDVIHKRIVQNIYNADIVVCDISGKNPNVMFELGMRLTFDKPTIIIKDDATDFIFDTGLIEHLTYPKDLRFNKIVKFQTDLAKAIAQTYKKSIEDSKFSTFLGNFGEFKVPALHQTPVSDVQQLILEEISSVRREVNTIKKVSNSYLNNKEYPQKSSQERIEELFDAYLDLFEDLYLKSDDEVVRLRNFIEINGIQLNAQNLNYLNFLIDMHNKEN